MTRKPDRNNSFSARREHEIEGFGYRIHLEDRSSHVAVIAPHGGFIEPATSEIALAIADERYSLYRFEGLDAARLNHELHITAEKFDEPIANGLVSSSSIVVAVHGRGSGVGGGRHALEPRRSERAERPPATDVRPS